MTQMDSRDLSIMVFPQQWSGSEIISNVLLLPNRKPTAPVQIPTTPTETELPFSQAQPVLKAVFLPGLSKPCWDPAIDPASLVNASPFYTVPPGQEQPGLNQPAFKADIFSALAQQFTPSVQPRMASKGGVKKDLPPTYLAAGGPAPQPGSASADDYGCDLRDTGPHTVPVSPRTMAWGEIFSYALRQPIIAQAIGMSYLEVRIPFSPAAMTDGGWLWMEIDTGSTSNWYARLVEAASSPVVLPANQQPVRSYAARIPPLAGPQKLFSAILFPTLPTAPKPGSSVLDEAQYEADQYTDGFAAIVHTYQPAFADAIIGDDQTLVPGTDAGFQIGWDDAQVTAWYQRQVQTAQDMNAGNAADEFPLGVHGYRVDARQVPDGNADPATPTPAWQSLVAVNASVSAGDSFSATAVQELTVEPTPVSNGGSLNFWLPRYFAHWRGRSLVVNDQYAYAFGSGDPPAEYAQNPSAPQFSGTLTEILNIGLRYGQWYQFRTRLADLTGGGPTAQDSSPDAGVATIQFLRQVPPKAPAVTKEDPVAAPPAILVTRPRLNYPEMVFAGAATDADLAMWLNQVQSGGFSPDVFVPDPDVTTLEIIVEAQAPAHDTGNPASLRDMSTPPEAGDLDGNYRVVYRHQVPFTGTVMNLSVQPQPVAQIRLIPLPAAGSLTLPVPAGRNLRIRIRGLGTGDSTYWGSSLASTGLVTDVQVRYETPSEPKILLTGPAASQLQAYYLRDDPAAPQEAVTAKGVLSTLSSSDLAPGLQHNLASVVQSPTPTPLERLAQALDLPSHGQTLTGPPGRRVLFGAQNTLRHSVTQDLSSLTFASLSELTGRWIVVIRVTLDRDWTYSGIAQNGPGQTGFVLSGAASMTDPDPAPAEVGRVNLPGVVSALSVQPTPDPAQRDQTDLIFFATVDSTVGPDQFPDVTHTSWSLTGTFTGHPTLSIGLWSGTVDVPITLNPRQTPKLVSAGIAESPYVADAQYAATEPRQRALWLEFDSPPEDPQDQYFYRVLGYGPDPLLVSRPSDLPKQGEPSLSVDPEWIRMIAAGDTNDDAGAGAMAQLLAAQAPLSPSGQPVHYLLPVPGSLPPSALELFGFWTIEVRCGHTLWSTAQARYGRPLRVSGVQFPAPQLTVSVDRRTYPFLPAIVASANLAQTVYNGVSLTQPGHPQTQIWFLLYAQVPRVDGQAWRNILLGKVLGKPLNDSIIVKHDPDIQAQNWQIPVAGHFTQPEVENWLNQWQLPASIPTSIVAVELFNGEHNVIAHDADQSVPTAQEAGQDPLGSELGARRILRVSPLTPVRAVC